MKPLLISVNQACEIIGLGRTKTYELINQNLIESKMIGRRRLITLESVCSYALGAPERDVN